jgi:hypothetical protein
MTWLLSLVLALLLLLEIPVTTPQSGTRRLRLWPRWKIPKPREGSRRLCQLSGRKRTHPGRERRARNHESEAPPTYPFHEDNSAFLGVNLDDIATLVGAGIVLPVASSNPRSRKWFSTEEIITLLEDPEAPRKITMALSAKCAEKRDPGRERRHNAERPKFASHGRLRPPSLA